jgi:hypothetical protein
MEPGALTPTIITPPLDCESFEVNGVVYTCTSTLALGRARLLQRFRTELQFNLTIAGVQQSLMQMREFLKASNHYDSCVLLDKLIDGSNLIGANRIREAEIVALFFIAPDEDPTTYSYESIKQKVETAWRAVSDDFFTRKAVLLLLRTSGPYPSLQEVLAGLPSADSLSS